MFIFSIIFIGVFIYAINGINKKREELILNYFIFALPIYITALSTTMLFGFDKIVPLLQYSKELLVLITLLALIVRINDKVKFHLFDQLVLLYLLIVFCYNLLPLGGLSLYQKLVATKSITIFCFVYFIGRLIPYQKVNLTKYLNYISLVGVAAGLVVLLEFIFDKHLQTKTGYAEFMFKYFSQEAKGNYGLSWTFETQNGLKRYASFFSMPLEHAASTLLSVAVIGALITRYNNKIKLDKITIAAILGTILSILFAVSRASFISYAFVIYFYAIITKRIQFLKWVHITLAIIIIIFLLYVQGDVYDFIMNSISFTDSSSLTHLLAWAQGIESVSLHPMGIGLGTSGNVANSFGSSLGGENEFLIIGIQVGILPMLIYTFLYIYTIVLSVKYYKAGNGKLRQLALLLLLLKVGLIIPSLSAEAESYLYISYLTWFFTGYLINLISTPGQLHSNNLTNH
jgi:hypothetical protein